MIEKFRKIHTNTFSTGDLPLAITWISGMSQQEFVDWEEFVQLTIKTARRTVNLEVSNKP